MSFFLQVATDTPDFILQGPTVVSCAFLSAINYWAARGETSFREKNTMLVNNIVHIKFWIFLSQSLGHVKVKLAWKKSNFSQITI